MADEYEHVDMPGKGEVLYRQKVRGPNWVTGLVGGLPLAFGAIATALLVSAASPLVALGAAVGALTLSAALTTLMVVYSAARIVVSEGELHLQLGPNGPTLDMEDIESFQIEDSGYGGYGMGARKLIGGGTLYRMFGDGRRALRLQTRGRTSPIYIVCPEPEKLVDALTRAKSRVRVRVGSAEGHGEEAASADDVAEAPEPAALVEEGATLEP